VNFNDLVAGPIGAYRTKMGRQVTAKYITIHPESWPPGGSCAGR
jgi:hypothetical protein